MILLGRAPYNQLRVDFFTGLAGAGVNRQDGVRGSP